MNDQLIQTVTAGPIGVFFTNQNTEMGLAGHSHSAELTLEFLTLPGPDCSAGFPVFHDTMEALTRRAQLLTDRAFRNATNEVVARQLFEGFDGWTVPEVDKWGGRWVLLSLTLAVRGVRDRIGHAQGDTRYRVARTVEAARAQFNQRSAT